MNPKLLVSGPNGARPLSESVAHCTRCNACLQTCPSYLLHKEEAFSPRGRNQILRLLLERKIKPSSEQTLIRKTVQECLLCARCTAACAGALPVADHMLALRRKCGLQSLPASLKTFLRWRVNKPFVFEWSIKIMLTLRRLGLLRILRLCGILKLSSLNPIARAADIVPPNGGILRRTLCKQKVNFTPENPDIVYLPSFEAEYLEENIALHTLRLCKNKKTHILFHFPSGLFEYLYGDKSLCLKQAKKLLVHWEKLCPNKKTVLLTDGLETYLFLKKYPVLFAAFPRWRMRAEAFAAKVRFVTDLSFSALPKVRKDGLCALDASSILYPAGETAVKARKILKTHLGKNFVECEYSRFSVPAGSAAFVRGANTRETTLENVKDVARRQIRQVYCLSGLAAMELDAALRRHYPQARARHISYLQSEER